MAAGLPPAGPLEWDAALERARAALRGMVTGAWEAKLAANGSTLLDAAGGAPRGPPVCDLEKAFDAVVARLDPRVFRGSPFAGDFLFRVVDEAVEQHVQHDGDGARCLTTRRRARRSHLLWLRPSAVVFTGRRGTVQPPRKEGRR